MYYLKTAPRALGILFSLVVAFAGVNHDAAAQPNTPLEKLKAMAADTNTTPDLASACLLGSQLLRPNVDPAAYLKQLDEMAAELKTPLGNALTSLDNVNTLSEYIFNFRGYANSTVLPADIFVGLDQVIDGQQWNCVGMSVLYVTLGQRVGIPLRLVAGRGHVLVAFSGNTTFYAETTLGGRLEPDRTYLRDYLPFPCVDPASYEALDERGAIALCLTQMGLAVQQEERVQLATTLFELALEFSPDYAEALGGLAFIQVGEKKYPEAIVNFRKAVSIAPDFREAFGGLGNALSAQGDKGGAMDAYRTLVSLCPDDEIALFNMGQLLHDAGDLDGSIAAFERYIELVPEDPDGYRRIAYTLEDSNNLERAAEAYKRVLQLSPNDVDALANLGHLFEQVGDLNSAMAAYSQALDIFPSHLQAMAGTGRLLGTAGRYEDAQRILRRAIGFYPAESFLLVDLGRLFQDNRSYRNAIAAFQEATRIAPDDTEGYYALAEVLEIVGMKEEGARVRIQAQNIDAELAESERFSLPGGTVAVPTDTETETEPGFGPPMAEEVPTPVTEGDTAAMPAEDAEPTTPAGDQATPPAGDEAMVTPPLVETPVTLPPITETPAGDGTTAEVPVPAPALPRLPSTKPAAPVAPVAPVAPAEETAQP